MALVLFALVLFALFASPAMAQSVTGYRLHIYPAGAPTTATPLTTFDFFTTAVTCNVAAPAADAPTINPSRVIWDDPANAGKVCQWNDPGNGPLFAVPIGAAYEGTLRAFNAAGVGPESARSPFSRLAPPANAPAGVRLVRPGS